MFELFVVFLLAIVGLVLVMIGVPTLLVVALGVGGGVWLLASAKGVPPAPKKEKTPKSGCPFLDFFSRH